MMASKRGKLHHGPLRIVVVMGVMLVGLGGCGGGSSARNTAYDSVTQQFETAVAFKDNGQCEQAVPILERLAQRGRGWELAQVHLGDCRLAAGDVPAAMKLFTVAAESNEPRAQARLAMAYLDGQGVAPDRAEAAKWYLLATRSTLDGFVNAADFPDNFKARMVSSLSEADLAAGQARVDSWIPTYQGVNAELVNKPRPRRPEPGADRLRTPRQRLR